MNTYGITLEDAVKMGPPKTSQVSRATAFGQTRGLDEWVRAFPPDFNITTSKLYEAIRARRGKWGDRAPEEALRYFGRCCKKLYPDWPSSNAKQTKTLP